MPPGLLLAGAVLALLLGPLASSVARQDPQFRALLDGFAAFTVGGFALLLLMPSAVRDGGSLALLFMLSGLAIPGLLHRISRETTITMTDRALVLGLAVHAAVESAAMATAPAGEPLGFAVVAHRLPVGLAVFSLARNPRAGWLAIAVLVPCQIVLGVGLFGALHDHPKTHELALRVAKWARVFGYFVMAAVIAWRLGLI